MSIITVQDKYVETLNALGDLEDSVNIALQRYAIEQITTKINELRRKSLHYQQKYHLDYPTCAQRMAEDADFVHHIEATISKTWELDLTDWEFCHKGIADWTQKLEAILLI